MMIMTLMMDEHGQQQQQPMIMFEKKSTIFLFFFDKDSNKNDELVLFCFCCLLVSFVFVGHFLSCYFGHLCDVVFPFLSSLPFSQVIVYPVQYSSITRTEEIPLIDVVALFSQLFLSCFSFFR